MTRTNRLIGTLLCSLCLCLLGQVSSHAQLQALVSLDLSGLPIWNYTVTNSEPGGSGNQVTTFFLPIFAPVANVLAPPNWDVQTDDSTYILWANTGDPANDIAPGSSLSGFTFTSQAGTDLSDYKLLSYDHLQQQAGPSTVGGVLAPNVPEPGSLSLLIGLGLAGGVLASRHRRW